MVTEQCDWRINDCLAQGNYPLRPTTSETNPHAWSMAARDAFNRHWRLYIFEGAELAIFMISACFATVYQIGDPRQAKQIRTHGRWRHETHSIDIGACIFLKALNSQSS